MIVDLFGNSMPYIHLTILIPARRNVSYFLINSLCFTAMQHAIPQLLDSGHRCTQAVWSVIWPQGGDTTS